MILIMPTEGKKEKEHRSTSSNRNITGDTVLDLPLILFFIVVYISFISLFKLQRYYMFSNKENHREKNF